MIAFAFAAAVAAASALPQEVTPVAPVPRFGPGSPVYTEPGRYDVAPSAPYHRYGPARRSTGLHRAGPPGTALPSGQVGPVCSSQLWKAGFHAVNVDCPLYLPAQPGAVEHCVAHDAASRAAGVRVTFLDWNPATNKGAITCHRE